VPAQKWLKRLPRNILATREGDVRMPGTKVRFDPYGQRGVGNFLVELKEVRMTLADANPDYLWPTPCREDTDSL
jgi:hypothetical protein